MGHGPKSKIYTLRHFLFYMGLAGLAGVLVAIASEALGWSHGLSFAALVVTGLTVSMTALREDLFAPARRSAASSPTARPFLSSVGIACMAAAVLWSIFQVVNGSYGISVTVLLLAGLIASTPGLRDDLLPPSRRARAARRGRRHA